MRAASACGMKIMFLVPNLSGGGAERQLAYLASELHRRGHDVSIGYNHDGPGIPPPDVPVRRLPRRHPWDPRRIADTLSLIRACRPEVVQTCTPPADVVGGIAARLAGVPLIVREPSGASYDRGVKSRLRVMVARGAAVIVANSPGGDSYWAAAVGRSLQRRIIPNAVPLTDIENTAPIARPAAGGVAVYAGRLEPLKNVDVLLRACAAVMRERDLTLYICGDGSQRAKLVALANELGVETRVHFTGFIAGVWRYQRAADFTALLSDFEGQPNAALESFAAGAPMILSDIPEHRHLARGDTALFVPPRDVDATARAICELLDDRTAALARAARARSLVEDSAIHGMASAFEEVYMRAISRRGGR
jgi:glycosyltransferase involved in cell wall biosynthesis